MEAITNLAQIITLSLGLLGLYLVAEQIILLIKWIIKYATKKNN
jgi:hypothetical protein